MRQSRAYLRLYMLLTQSYHSLAVRIHNHPSMTFKNSHSFFTSLNSPGILDTSTTILFKAFPPLNALSTAFLVAEDLSNSRLRAKGTDGTAKLALTLYIA